MADDSSDSASISSEASTSNEDLSGSVDEDDDLLDLQRESEMPLDELMRRFQHPGGETSSLVQSYEVAVRTCDLTPDADEDAEESDDSSSSSTAENAHKKRSLFTLFMKSATANKAVTDDDDERDCDYDPIFDIEDFYKVKEPRIGAEYQAEFDDHNVLNGQLEEDNTRVGSLLWSPNVLAEDVIKRYLLQFYGIYTKTVVENEMANNASSKVGSLERDNELLMHNNVPDHEHALFQLLLSDFDIDEALRYWGINPPLYIAMAPCGGAGSMPLNPIFDVWSEDEVRLFEWALRLYGKQFHLIQEKTLPGRTVFEIVNFYYWYKVTDRYHELRASKNLANRYVDIADDEATYGTKCISSELDAISS